MIVKKKYMLLAKERCLRGVSFICKPFRFFLVLSVGACAFTLAVSDDFHQRRRHAARTRQNTARDERRRHRGENTPRTSHQPSVVVVRPPPRPRQSRPAAAADTAPAPDFLPIASGAGAASRAVGIERGEEEPPGENEGDEHPTGGADDVQRQL